jgi:hypothetical protein
VVSQFTLSIVYPELLYRRKGNHERSSFDNSSGLTGTY